MTRQLRLRRLRTTTTVTDVNVAISSNVGCGQLRVINACGEVDIGNTAKGSYTNRQSSRAGHQATTFASTAVTGKTTLTIGVTAKTISDTTVGVTTVVTAIGETASSDLVLLYLDMRSLAHLKMLQKPRQPTQHIDFKRHSYMRPQKSRTPPSFCKKNQQQLSY